MIRGPEGSGNRDLRKPFWKRWWFWVGAVAFLAALISNAEEDQPEVEVAATTTTTDAADGTYSTRTTVSPTTTIPSSFVHLPEYSIVEEEDVSFAGAVRISLRVTVEEGATAEQLDALATQLSMEYRESHQYQAFNIFFYHFPELAYDVTTLGSWDDSPFGAWGRAGDVERGDYSNHEPNDQTKEKDWSLLPTQQQLDLYAAYNKIFDQMDTHANELPSDDDVIAAVSEESDISTEEIEEALDAVFIWIFNDLND